jgi:hypothetical protein
MARLLHPFVAVRADLKKIIDCQGHYIVSQLEDYPRDGRSNVPGIFAKLEI